MEVIYLFVGLYGEGKCRPAFGKRSENACLDALVALHLAFGWDSEKGEIVSRNWDGCLPCLGVIVVI